MLQNISLQVLQGTQTKGTPEVSLAHTALFMGNEYVGKEGTPGKLVMTNTGSGALSISSIVVADTDSTMFPMSQNCGTSLAAGASCTLTIYFKPTVVGACIAEIVIYDDAGSGKQTVTLTGTGMAASGGTPVVSLPHTSLYMGSEVVGVWGTPALLVMTNSGTGTLSISGITVGGADGSDFPMTQNCGTSLAAGKSCTLTIYIKPLATGTRTGLITIKDNAGSGAQTVALTGTGVS
jgi:hypothetical protein